MLNREKFDVKKGKLFYFSILAVTTFILQGCVNIATTGAQAIYNRHSLEKNLKDQYLTMRAYHALYTTNEFKNTNFCITTYNKEMLLAGQAPLIWQKNKAEIILKNIPDVKKVYNLVKIESPSSTLTRISDAWITAKIKAKMMASNDVDVTKVKVITENGTVYLMGTLLPEQADAAVDVASNTDGVLNVVKIFYYMKISKNPNG